VTAAEFLGLLAARGGHLTVEGDRLRYHGPRELATLAMVEFVKSHREELREFLLRHEDDMTDAELAALGFRRREPDARILRDPDEPEPRAWTPPPGWQPERDDEEVRP